MFKCSSSISNVVFLFFINKQTNLANNDVNDGIWCFFFIIFFLSSSPFNQISNGCCWWWCCCFGFEKTCLKLSKNRWFFAVAVFYLQPHFCPLVGYFVLFCCYCYYFGVGNFYVCCCFRPFKTLFEF